MASEVYLVENGFNHRLPQKNRDNPNADTR